jgi:Zn-dependent protease
VPIGSFAGIQVRIHLTFVALVLLVAWSSAAMGEDVVDAVGWLLIIFGCVVVHELAHSLVARRRGVEVHEIDLLPIGGVSQMDRMPERSDDELAIALAGPLASVGIAVVAAAVAGVMGVDLLPVAPWSGAIVARLVWMNLLLAGFNLVPAFPSDGGRVLRALLERDRPRVVATQQAAQVGRVIAVVLMVVGALWSIWLIVIGVFIWWSGRAEEAAVVVHDVLGPVAVAVLAVPCPVRLPAEASVAEVAATLDAVPQVAYPVVAADGGLVGVAPLAVLRAAPPGASVAGLAVDAWVPEGTMVEVAGPELERAGLVGIRPIAGDDGVVWVLTADMVGDYLRRRLSAPG